MLLIVSVFVRWTAASKFWKKNKIKLWLMCQGKNLKFFRVKFWIFYRKWWEEKIRWKKSLQKQVPWKKIPMKKFSKIIFPEKWFPVKKTLKNRSLLRGNTTLAAEKRPKFDDFSSYNKFKKIIILIIKGIEILFRWFIQHTFEYRKKNHYLYRRKGRRES